MNDVKKMRILVGDNLFRILQSEEWSVQLIGKAGPGAAGVSLKKNCKQKADQLEKLVVELEKQGYHVVEACWNGADMVWLTINGFPGDND